MADDKKEPKKSGEFRVPPRTWILWIAILGAIPLLLLFRTQPDREKDHLSEPAFMELFNTNKITSGTIWWDIQSPLLQDVSGIYIKGYAADGKPVLGKFTATIHIDDTLMEQLRASGKFESKRPNTLVQNMPKHAPTKCLVKCLNGIFA